MNIPESYHFSLPGTIVSGTNSLWELNSLLKEKRIKKPLLISEERAIHLGMTDLLLKEMKKKNGYTTIPHFIYRKEDTLDDILSHGAAFYRKMKCDSIIALGSKTVIDTAKGIEIFLSDDITSLSQWTERKKNGEKRNLLVAIPTTAGSGIEESSSRFLGSGKQKESDLSSQPIQPDITIIDSRLTETLPPAETAMTAMEVMAHACDAYLSPKRNPISSTLALKALTLISENLLETLENPDDESKKVALLNASALAGMACENASLDVTHTFATALMKECAIPYGLAHGIILPYSLEYNMPKYEKYIGELLFPLGGTKIYNSTPKKKRGQKTIETIRFFNQSLYIQTAGKYATSLKDIMDENKMSLIPKDQLTSIAHTVTNNNRINNIHFDDAFLILMHAWDGLPLKISRLKKR